MITETTLGPKYRHIQESLINRIEQGEFLPGTRIPTEDELIKVSKTTVRRAISDLVYAGRLSREQGRGTFVIDRESLVAKRRKNIGLVFMNIYDPHQPYLSKIIHVASLEANNIGHNVQILTTPAKDLSHKESSFLMDTIIERHIDGLILASRMKLEDILILKKEHIPFIYVNNDVPDPDVVCIFSNHFISSYEISKHLIELGHKRIALITDTIGIGSAHLILSTYRFVHQKYNLEVNEAFIKQGELSCDTGEKIMKELLVLPERPTAVFAWDDVIAMGVIRAIWDAGLKVPEDIAVVGQGNLELPVGISLTSVDNKSAEIGRLAVQILIKMIDKEYSGPHKIITKPELIIRESTVGRGASYEKIVS